MRSKTNATETRLVRGPINGISEYVLANGLKVLLLPDPNSAVVTTAVVYRVGSANEGPGNTGSAHFFEHLMFKGSRRFNMGKGTNLDALLKQIGARYNAYTWNDETVYYEQASAEYLELCLSIEADRMRHLRMTKADRDSEMTVVRNEMEQGENHPEQLMSKQMYATVFTQHPYHHDTIGSRTDVENVPMENMRDFYNTYYWPNNATLLVVGGFEIPAALALIEKTFGKLPRSPHKIPQIYTVEPPQTGERTFKIHKAGKVRQLQFGFPIPEAVHGDMPALTALCEVLGNSFSRSSRLYQRLVDSGLASRVYASAREMRHPGILTIGVDLTPTADLEQVKAAVLEEIERLKTELVGDEELTRIKIGRSKNDRLQYAESTSLAMQLVRGECVADWLWFVGKGEAFAAVTADDIRRVAELYLTEKNRTVGAFIPDNTAKKSVTAVPPSVAAKPKKERKRTRAIDPNIVNKTLARLSSEPPARASFGDRIVTRTLSNGLTLNVLPLNAGSGAVAVGIAVKAGNYYEDESKQNLADIVASMLPMGSVGLTKAQLADELTEMGTRIGLNFNVDPYVSKATIKVVSGELGRGLRLVGTVLRHPLFEESALDTVKRQWHDRYLKSQSSPASVVHSTLQNVCYPAGLMFHQKTFDEQIADLAGMTVADLQQFHAAAYTPGNTILTLVGDVDAEAAIAEVEEIFADWAGAGYDAVVVPDVPLPAEQKIVHKMADKPGIAIIIGRPSTLCKTAADFEAASLAMRVLGGDTLTARLGKKLREEGGLTYGVYTTTGDASYGSAPWYVSLSVNAANVEPAIAMTRSILADFYEGGITEAELETQKSSMIGAHNLGLTTLWELAQRVATLSALGQGFDEIDNRAATIRALTVDDVNAAIRKYLNPEGLVTVIAGEV